LENNVCVFENGKSCNILTKKECVNCSFFKTEEQYRDHKKKADERFDRLSFDRRKEICDKYHLTVAEAVAATPERTALEVEEKEVQENAD